LGYPTSVFSPSARSNGQTIDASHVNDLQTEQTAVQTALLGTITHSLNVSGASTLATLQAVASTFTVRPVEPPPHAAVVQSTIVDIVLNTTTAINWTHQTLLTNSSMHSTGTNPERLTPQSTGVYVVSANVVMSGQYGASSGNLQLAVQDSSRHAIGEAINTASSNQYNGTVYIAGLKRFDVIGGWVRAVVRIRDASTQSVSTLSRFSLHKL
jgi:hypothetical protein